MFASIIKKIRSHDFVRKVLVLFSGTVLAQALPILFMPIIGRLYDAQAMGVYTVYTAIINITQQLACLRFDYAIVVSDDDDEASGCFVLSIVFSVLFSLALAAALIPSLPLVASFLGLNELSMHTLWAIPITTLICGTTTALNYYNVRLEKYKVISVSTVVKSLASVAIQIGLFFLFWIIGLKEFAFWGMILGQLLSNLFGNLTLLTSLKGKITKKILTINYLSSILVKNVKYPKFMLPSSVANSFTLNMSSITVSSVYSVQDAGLYGMVNRILGLPLTMISNAVSQVFLKQASVDKNNRLSLEATFKTVTKYLLLIGIVPFGILFLFSNPLLPLFLGQEWAATSTILKLTIPLFLTRFVVTPLTSTAIALGKQKQILIWQLVLLASVLLPTIAAFITPLLDFNYYLLLSSITMSIAYILFYRYCQKIIREEGKA